MILTTQDYINTIKEYLEIPKDLMYKAFNIFPEPFNSILIGFAVVIIAIILLKLLRG